MARQPSRVRALLIHRRKLAGIIILFFILTSGATALTVKNRSYSDLQPGHTNANDKILVTVGDEFAGTSANSFAPRLNFSRWDEVWFTLLPINIWPGSGAVTMTINQTASKVTARRGNITINFYNVSNGNGFEYEITFAGPPANNTLQFTLNNKNTDFVLQHGLDEEMKNVSCTPTDCIGAHRPENIVNSYAIYYRDPPPNVAGGKSYGSGKIGHLNRSEVIAADGKRAWVETNITGTVMTIQLPVEWMKTAVYPVTLDPLFGYTTIGGTTDYSTNLNNYITNSTIAIPAGTTSSISWYAGSPWAISAKMCMWKWSDNSLAGCSNSFSLGDAAWNTANLVVTTDGSSTYWLGIVGDNSSMFIYPAYAYDAKAAGNFTIETLNNYATPANLNYNSAWSHIYASRTASAYVTYTAGGAGAAPVCAFNATVSGRLISDGGKNATHRGATITLTDTSTGDANTTPLIWGPSGTKLPAWLNSSATAPTMTAKGLGGYFTECLWKENAAGSCSVCQRFFVIPWGGV